ncbi:hypothetical protein [Vibrio breoganii]|uniref:hypothetical protein n=1 Tax=Vibrio breoganii TaxID=553239 RepID=UPI000C83165B|nr:hypothetical protein [Vibrio breoganii]PMG97744.1 hypothetical protein BCU80_18315 [Vibrio breoganii]
MEIEISDISLIGLLSCIIIIFGLFKKGLYQSLVDPKYYILLMHVYFLGVVPYELENKLLIEILLLISFVIFYFSFSLSSSAVHTYFLRTVTLKVTDENDFLKNARVGFLLLFIILWVLFTTIYNAYIFGGLERSLIRFYILKPVNETSFLFNFLDRIGAKLSIAAVFCISLICTKRNCNHGLIFLSVVVVSVGVVPLGTRGNLILLLFSVLVGIGMAKSVSKYKARMPLLTFIFTTVFISFLFVFLTNNRTVNLIENESILFSNELNSSYVETSKDVPIVVKYIDITIDDYGVNRDFQYAHTLYAILSNPIPRKYWGNKPVGFGKILATNINNDPDTPISFAASYSGEGWFNGGVIGVVFMSIFAGSVSGVLRSMSLIQTLNGVTIFSLLKYMLFFSSSLMFVRGDMLSGWTSAIYPIVVLYLFSFAFNNFRNGLNKI